MNTRIPILNAYSKNRDVVKRTANARYLTEHLSAVSQIKLPAVGNEDSCYIYPIECEDRYGLATRLTQVEVEVILHEDKPNLMYVPCHDGLQRCDLDLIIEVIDSHYQGGRPVG